MKTHDGGCHCGSVRFRVQLDDNQALACNCSMCRRMGWLLTFVQATSFELLKGDDAVTDYQFGKKHIHHLFCATCGIRSFARGENPDGGGETFAVNLRCLDDLDLSTLQIQEFDGASL